MSMQHEIWKSKSEHRQTLDLRVPIPFDNQMQGKHTSLLGEVTEAKDVDAGGVKFKS